MLKGTAFWKVLVETASFTSKYNVGAYTCVKKSGKIQPHSKQVRLGLLRLGLIRAGFIGLG